MKRVLPLALSALLASTSVADAQTRAYTAAQRAADSTQALSFFRGNIASIHRRDRPAYLRHYLQSPRLARVGPGGVNYGYQGLATPRDSTWPDTLVATHFEVVPLSPGVVYGTYRYRVAQGGSSRGVSERVLVRQPDGSWKIAVSTAFGSPGNAPVPAFALTHATVIDGTGRAPLRDATVVMRGGKIECVGVCRIEPGVEVVDARGKWIIPGLVDAHVHYSQTGWADGRPDALDVRQRFPYDSIVAQLEQHPERFYRSQLCAGVTATFDVGGYPWTWSLRGPAEASTSAPHVAAAGPLLSTIDHWVNVPAARQFVWMGSDSATLAGARMMVHNRSDAVKVWYLAEETSPDTAAFKARLRVAAAEARRGGIPLIVHATDLWQAKDALRAGAKLLVHSVEDKPVDDEFLALAKQAGAIYTPTLTVADGYVMMFSRRFDPTGIAMTCVDPDTRGKIALTASLPARIPEDRMAAFRQRIATQRQTMLANLRRVRDAGIPIAMGTDAGNPLTLHGASVYREMDAMAEAGMTPMEVLVSSTRTAALAMRRTDIGTLEPGKIADLVVLDADPLTNVGNLRRVRLVARGGEIWTREELEYR
ncbi:MAG TPA: amidohydrolase family protein [Longimicrobium sp.]|nr:amidohydrolase family protein [Longimicrobium sp.]